MLIQRCMHCGEKVGRDTKLCQQCNLKSKRAEMDAANKEIFKKAGQEFHCEYCEREKRRKEDRLEQEEQYAG